MALYCTVRLLLLAIVLFKPSVSSEKKGYAIAFRNFLCDDFKAFGNVTWWYDWWSTPFYYSLYNCTGLQKYDASHVPMIWGIPKSTTIYIPETAQAVLGFNEPNHKKQSNVLPETAARFWPHIEKAAAGIPLVSPSASSCGTPSLCNRNRTQWFDEFFRACTGCRVDYLATHFYSCNANRTMDLLEGLYKRYNRKIWLTEFACHYTKDPKKELEYMRHILPRLEQADFIHRYSWFVSRDTSTSGYVTEAASLLKPNVSELTQLGQFYVDLQSCRVDYLATHVYDCSPGATMQKIERLYTRFRKKIWLTEFACPTRKSFYGQMKYMTSILPRLEASDLVYRYSWYQSRISDKGFVPRSASLLKQHTSELTPLGEVYVSSEHERRYLKGDYL